MAKARFTHTNRDGKEIYLTWYQATRHTFASHSMMACGNLSKLQAELGHSDIQTTQRYAKLAPDYRSQADRQLIRLPKVRGEGKIVAFPQAVGSKGQGSESRKGRNKLKTSSMVPSPSW